MTQDDFQPASSQIGGYVLAGGHSSRMGQDKALIPLAGQPLVAHAVAKLRGLCGEVHILAGEQPPASNSKDAALAAYAPLVYDLHPGCGPIAGVQAALTHSPHSWNLILPVDMPLLPAALLGEWVGRVVGRSPARVALFEIGGRLQAMPLLIHRDARPYLTRAIERGEYTLLAALQGAAAESGGAPDISVLKAGEREEWFANLNTPGDLALAEAHLAALDPL